MRRNAEIYYNSNHESYIKFYGQTFQAHRPGDIEELHVYLNRQIGFNAGDKVLDAGCGVCGPAVYFAQNNEIIIDAVTNSVKQIETARDLIDSKCLNERIRLHHYDYQDINRLFQSEFFDKIVFLESYGHSDNKEKLLNAAYQILKFEGYIYIKDYFATEITGNVLRRKLMRKARRNLAKEYCYYLADLYDTLKICRKLGLAIDFVRKPDFILSNDDVVGAFEKELKIDLFGNKYMPIIVEPLEMRLKKVIRDTKI